MLRKDEIRTKLIDSVHSKNEAKGFFESNTNNYVLLKILVAIAIDDYSGDARMEASYWISQFNPDLLKRVENELLKIQEDEMDSIACHIFIALGKIKSKAGLKYLIEKRLEPDFYWEAQALKYYLNDFLK